MINKNNRLLPTVLPTLKNNAKTRILLVVSLLAVGCSSTQESQLTVRKPEATEDTPVISATPKPVGVAQAPHIELEPLEIPDRPIPVFDAWQRVLNNFALDISLDNRRITVQRQWYAANQDYLDRTAERASRYLFDVIEQIEARGMPGELALLPIVESAYAPFAYSHGRASGIWQFIPGTGKRYKLKQDWWYDGRRDVVESTRAALDYLSDLYKYFDNDWLLALAAYNSGQGNVRKAIKHNRKHGRPTDFWSLKLPRETQAYVPKLIALAQLLHAPDKYGASFNMIDNRPYFSRVSTGSQIDLAQAAELAEISLEELYLLNPGFNQWATPPYGSHLINLPVSTVATFKTNLAKLPAEQRISWVRYKIKNGDSLIRIANKFQTSADALRQVNKLKSYRIRAGNVLFIPVASRESDHYVLSADKRLEAKQQSPANSGRIKKTYVAQTGDSFWTISRRYGVGMRELARWNGLGTTDRLPVGRELVIWVKPPPVVTTAPQQNREIIHPIIYKVRSGDSLARIAQKFNVSIADIESWNSINRRKYLQPGQTLKLFVDLARTSL